MLIKSMHIENYRCILEETIDLDDLTIMVGANGAGKSTILRAVELFYSSNPSIIEDDFYARDLSRKIVISLTYTDLSDKAKERFAKYLRGDELMVDMVVVWVDDRPNITYHGSRLQNPDFEQIYSPTNKTEARKSYNELRQQDVYKDLPIASNYGEVHSALQTWEEANQDKCKRMRDDGQFFGYKQVGRGYLFEYSQFVFISAIRDASADSEESRGSVITRIMDLVVRNALASREELTEFKQTTQERYEEILKPDNLSELSTLRNQLSTTLQTFVPNAAIELNWQPLETLNIPMPKANIGLVEDGYRTRVEMTGHGLQRAFIFTMLQHLALAQSPQSAATKEVVSDEVEEADLPSFIIAIEEPELYQHPNRQRHFGRVLRKLATGELSGVVRDIQIICATHSPLFIDMLHFNEVRLVRKLLPVEESLPKAAKVYKATYADIVQEMQRLKDDPCYTVEKLRALVPQLMTPFMNEGFFADVAVIVEGESDRAALIETANQNGIDLESMGIAIVPSGGKGNIIIPAVIFRKLGIPTFLVWDCDNKSDNDDLFNYVGYKPVSRKGNQSKRLRQGDVIEPRFAAFYKTREYTLENEVGKQLYHALLDQCGTELGTNDIKKPVVVQRLTQLVFENGRRPPSVESLVQHILTMRQALST